MSGAGFQTQGTFTRTPRTSAGERLALLTELERALTAVGRTMTWISSGLLANRPTAQYVNRLYIATDAQPYDVYFDTGSEWVNVTNRGEFHLTHLALDAEASTHETLFWVIA